LIFNAGNSVLFILFGLFIPDGVVHVIGMQFCFFFFVQMPVGLIDGAFEGLKAEVIVFQVDVERVITMLLWVRRRRHL